ncbi:DsbA family protein [Silvibacterium sp.]|uniref:DsbA family protein n=1 Tax=Silvibacterium sp. TaxID=1964179 RepID=UPI0039E53905
MMGFQMRTFFAASAAAIVAVAAPLCHAENAQSALKPPAGSHVAIVEFADLECPMCAHENPVLMDAIAKYHVPWIRHDFPLQMHVWSFQAAVNARWFDTQNKKLGDDYRNAVFASQNSIETKDDLASFTQKFAQQHGTGLPFVVDPQGKLTDEVKADYNLGMQLGVHQTPTAWVVTDGTGGAAPKTEVTDFNKLYTMLDQAIAQTSHGKK